MKAVLTKELHETAMRVAVEADVYFLEHKKERNALYAAACLLEKKCYSIIERENAKTKSIIGISAAALAYKAGMFKEAVKIIYKVYEDGFIFEITAERSLRIIEDIEQNCKEKLSKRALIKMESVKSFLLERYPDCIEEEID